MYDRVAWRVGEAMGRRGGASEYVESEQDTRWSGDERPNRQASNLPVATSDTDAVSGAEPEPHPGFLAREKGGQHGAPARAAGPSTAGASPSLVRPWLRKLIYAVMSRHST